MLALKNTILEMNLHTAYKIHKFPIWEEIFF